MEEHDALDVNAFDSIRDPRILGRSHAITTIGILMAPILFAVVTSDLHTRSFLFGENITIYGLVAAAFLFGAGFAYFNDGVIVSWALLLGVALPHYIEACSFNPGFTRPSSTPMCPIPLAYPFSIVNGIPIAVLVALVVGTVSYLLGRGIHNTIRSPRTV